MSEQVFHLPDLGEGLTEAEIIEWQVAEGDTVTIDQHVVVVETAKATVEVPCPYAGRVHTLHGGVGDVVQVGKPLISIAGDGASAADGSATDLAPLDHDLAGHEHGGTSRLRGNREEEQAGSGAVLIGYGTGDARQRRRRRGRRGATADTVSTDQLAVQVISPIVRKLAKDNGVDLAALVDQARGGVIRRSDVQDAIARPDPSGAVLASGDVRTPLRGMRKAIADKLTTSRREIPDATTWVDVDATGLMDAKDALRSLRPEAGIGVLALVARITVSGLQRYPDLNSSVDAERAEIVQHRRINLGFAAQSPRGLVVPVVHDAQQMSTAQLAAALRRLTEQARDGSLTPAQLTGGTFTLNNYGVFGVDGSTPIINHPEAAMLGIGRIIDKPWAHRGELALRKVTQLSFTFDHRVCDGGVAGGFLRYVADCVEAPTTLLAEL